MAGYRNPYDAGLAGIRFHPVGRNGVGGDLALKHELHPVNMPIALVGIVVLCDILADETQFPDLNRNTNLLQTLALEGFPQRFSMCLPAARQNVPLAIFVVDPDEQDTSITDDDGLGGIADERIQLVLAMS
jgi:hypothetical protein